MLILIGVTRGFFGVSSHYLIVIAIDGFVVGMFSGFFILYNCTEDGLKAQSKCEEPGPKNHREVQEKED